MTPADLAELQFFSALLGSILSEGAGDKRDPDAIACGAALEASFRAPGCGVAPKVRKAAVALSRRAVTAFRAPLIAEGVPVALAALIADRLLGVLTGCGYLVLHPGSEFDRAMELIRNGLVDVVDDAMRARAEAEWDVALRRVQGVGLFGSVTVVEVEHEMARAA